jgi:hypothetical protein
MLAESLVHSVIQVYFAPHPVLHIKQDFISNILQYAVLILHFTVILSTVVNYLRLFTDYTFVGVLQLPFLLRKAP